MGFREEFINSVKDGAIAGWHEHKILPSLIISQGILESDWGRSELATEANNLFGIKGSYEGESYIVHTKEYDESNDEWLTVEANFAKYPSKDVSIKEHSAFFTSTPWRANNYKHVIGEKDPRKAVESILTPIAGAGYATDPQYSNKIMNIIEEYDLTQYDEEAFGDKKCEPVDVVYLEDTTFLIDGEEYKFEEIKTED